MKPLSRRIYAVTALALAATIFVALNIAADASLTIERLDLTQTGVYTLASGTKHIVANLKEPIALRFFYSKKVAAGYAPIDAYARRVRDLLEEYAARSDGKIVLEEIDPEPFTAAEDEATANGLSGAPTDSGDEVYFGLVGTNTIDGKEVIPFFSEEREAYLEYDISSLIYHLSAPKKPELGIISTLPLDTGAGGVQAALQGDARPFMIYDELSQTYAAKMLDPNFASIPADIDVLMIVAPGPMTPAQLYAIDQFVLKGGRALVFVDPYSEIANAGQGSAPVSSDLPSLFRAWGISYDPAKVVADRDLAQSVQVSADPRNPVTQYPVWLKLDAAHFASKDQVTANLQTLNLASAGALGRTRSATTTFTPLAWSSKEASLLDAQEVHADSNNPQDLITQVQPTGQNYVVAARISGPANTSFPAGPPLPPADAAKAGPEIRSAKNINVIVMADTDIFDDRFWVRVENLYGRRMAAPFADNAAFVLNAVENLTGSNDLISLRTRAPDARPFVKVQQLQAKAEAQFQQQADMLKQQLSDTESRLHALEQGGSTNGEAANATSLTPEQQVEIDRFKHELVLTRTALREVQHNLRKEVDALGAFLAFVNIVLMPLLVALVAIGLAILRRRRRARAITV